MSPAGGDVGLLAGFFFEMATVKFPLWSLDASGSVGGLLTYSRGAGTAARPVDKSVDGRAYTAEYPARVLDGRGIVRLKPRARPDLKRRHIVTGLKTAPGQQLREDQFRVAGMLADWLYRWSLVVSLHDPQAPPVAVHGWWEGLYFQRGENRELRKFPGQPEGATLSIRRAITGTNSAKGYLMRQLLSRRLVRFDVTLEAFAGLTAAQKATWLPSGNAPWHLLPDAYDFGDFHIEGQTFVNIWMQAAELIARFALPKRWLYTGQRAGLWRATRSYPKNHAVVLAWEKHLSSGDGYKAEPVSRWHR